MDTKLTLRLEDRLIRKAKLHAQRSGKSVSKLVADYFAALGTSGPDESGPDQRDTPRVRSLRGAFKGASATRDDDRRYPEEKYR